MPSFANVLVLLLFIWKEVERIETKGGKNLMIAHFSSFSVYNSSLSKAGYLYRGTFKSMVIPMIKMLTKTTILMEWVEMRSWWG